MADFGLLSTGFNPKTLAVIDTEISAIIRSLFGAGIPLRPDTTFGKLKGIWSEREALIWELIEAVNDAFDPDKATDNSLDRLLKIIGLLRLLAASSTNVIYAAGTATTAVPDATLFAVLNTGDQFQSVGAVALGPIETVALTSLVQSGGIATATTGAAHGLTVGEFVFVDGAVITQEQSVVVNTVTDNEAYTVTLNGTIFEILSDGTATDVEIRDALVAAINAGAEPVTAAPGVSTDDLDITADVAGVGFTITVSANLTNTTTTPNVTEAESDFNGLKLITAIPLATTFEYAVLSATETPAEGTLSFSGTTAINVRSVDEAAIQAPAGALTVIVNAITGLDRVENAVTATLGRDVETDGEAKDRRDESLSFSGSGSVPSIRARLLNLAGVIEAAVTDNKTDVNVTEPVAIVGVVTGAGGSFTLSGNVSLFFPPDGPNAGFTVSGSTGNDGAYTVDTVALIGGDTRITVNESVPDSTVDGDITIITLTPHSIESVVDGGDDQLIADTIFEHYGGGIQYIGGSNKETVIDDGEPEEVRFSRPSLVDVEVELTLVADPEAKDPPVEADIIAAVSALGDAYRVGGDVIVGEIEAVGFLSTTGVKSLTALVTIAGGSPAASDIPISGRQRVSEFTSVTIP